MNSLTATGSGAASHSQQRIWFLDKLAPGSGANQSSRTFRLTGVLDVRAMRAAWWHVIRRHDILRTHLVDVDGRPSPQVTEEDKDSFVVLDVRSDRDADGDARRLCDLWAAIPLQVAAGPLVRLVVIRHGASTYRLQLVAHRSVADDASMTTILRELSAFYADATGTATEAIRPDRPAEPVRYEDAVERERSFIDSPDFDDQVKWWSGTRGISRGLTLPIDRVRPAGPSSRAAVARFDWGDELSAGIAGIAREADTQPGAVLLTGLLILLRRYHDDDQVTVGLATDTRTAAEPAGAVGPYATVVPLDVDFGDAPDFRTLLDRVARRREEVLARRRVPFDWLVAATETPVDPRRMPLCDALFVSPDADGGLDLTGVEVRREDVDPAAVDTDLVLTATEIAPTTRGFLAARASLFDASSAEHMLRQLRTLLGEALLAPGTPVGDLPLDCAGLGDLPLDDLPLTDCAPADPAADTPRLVHETVRAIAAVDPDRLAIDGPETSITYGELAGQAVRMANALRGLGDVRGRPVVVRMAQGPLLTAALLGVMTAGAHLVWFGTGDSGDRGRMVLGDLTPFGMVVDASATDDDLAAWYRREHGGLVADLASMEPVTAGRTARPDIDLDDWAYIAHTSGSTGRPKGIAQTHGALAQFVTWFATAFDIGPGARVAQWVAAEHDPALCEVFATIVAGATLCPVPATIRANPERLVDWLTAQRITHLQIVPSFAREILRVVAGRRSSEQLPTLSHLLLMGEALPGELTNTVRSLLPLVRVINLYGPTETIAATFHEIDRPVHGTAPIGRAIPGRDVLVLDENDRPCPIGVTGNIVIRSRFVTTGYLGDHASQRAPFQPLRGRPDDGEPVYRSGDLGRWRFDGLLEYRGRSDLQVKLFGNRLELSDIETALAAHPSVAECAVVALSDRDGLVARLVVYVVPRRGADGEALGTSHDWRSHLHRCFGRSALPALFKPLEHPLPRNVAGKVDRRRLPDPGPLASRTLRPPQNSVERRIAAIWTEVLDTTQFGTDDAFFTVGGDGPAMVPVLRRVHERLGVDLSLWDFFDNPSVRGLAALVRTQWRTGDGL